MDSAVRTLERSINSPEEIVRAWQQRKRMGVELSFSAHDRVEFPREDYEEKRWKRVVGKRTTWYIPLNDYPAEEIHCAGGPDSQGYGGSTISFTLENGEVVKEKGPWHSNSESLFHDTSIDIRNTHRTYGIIAVDNNWANGHWSYKDIIYKDSGPTPGHFNRIERLAQDIANLLDSPLYFYSCSPGGSYSAGVRPKIKLT